MAAFGTPIHVIEKLLNHSSGTIRGVAAIYNRRSYFEEMKIAVAHPPLRCSFIDTADPSPCRTKELSDRLRGKGDARPLARGQGADS